METIWKNWKEFNQVIKDKKVVFFGVDDQWFEKTLARSDLNLAYIVDNSEAHIGEKYFVNEKFDEVPIKSPKVLRQKEKDVYVVITSGSYASIAPQLESYGLKQGLDFCCAPPLINLSVIADIDACKTKLFVCSPDHNIYSELDKNKDVGGGLYLYDIGNNTCKKVFDGAIQHIIDAGDKYYVLDTIRCGLTLSKDFKQIGEFGFEPNAKAHGLAYDAKNNLLFIAKPGLEKISAYNAQNYKLEFEIQISDKYSKYKQEQHHINDIYVRDNYLYVALFSHSGNWHRGVFDGGIMEIDLLHPEKRKIIVNDAWMPHNICFIEGDLCYLDSMRGKFYKTTEKMVGTFYGNFIRGLAFDGQFYYIGTSESRYFDRLKGISNYIGMNAGFYLFDEETKAGKFFPLFQARQVRNVAVFKE